MRRLTWVVLAAFTLMSGLANAQVRIGAVGPLTGPSANSGLAMKKSWEYVVGKVNQEGGLMLDGRRKKLSLIFEDDQSRPEVGVSAAQKLLTRDNVDVLLAGLFNSSVTLAIMELAPDNPDILFYSGQSVSGAIAAKVRAQPQRFRNFWKFGYNSDALGSTIAGSIIDFANANQIPARDKSVAFVVEDSDFSKSNIEAMKPLLDAAGWKVTANEAVSMGYADFYPQIAKLRQLKPDVVVSIFTAPNAGAALVRQMNEQKFAPTHVAVFYPSLKEFRDAVGPLVDGLIYTPLLLDSEGSPEHKAFAAEMEAHGMSASLDYGLGICNAQILMDGMRRAQSAKADRISEALKATDFRCAVGRWVFDPVSHSPRVGKDFFVLPAAQFQGSRARIVWPTGPGVATLKKP